MAVVTAPVGTTVDVAAVETTRRGRVKPMRVLLIVVLIAMILLAIAFGLLGFSDLAGIGILGGIVAILGASLAFAVVAGYVADALVGVALASLVMRGENSSRWRELAVLALGAAVVAPLLGTASAFSAGLFVSQGCHGFEGGGPTRWRVAGSEGDHG